MSLFTGIKISIARKCISMSLIWSKVVNHFVKRKKAFSVFNSKSIVPTYCSVLGVVPKNYVKPMYAGTHGVDM